MARVTVEDCLKNVKNRFELVTVAAKRARQLMHGKEAKVDWDNDKATVVALREIAEGFINAQNVDYREATEVFSPADVFAHDTSEKTLLEKNTLEKSLATDKSFAPKDAADDA